VKPSAKDITDAQVVDAVRATSGRNGVPAWATTWDLVEHLSAYPPKVVLTKLRSAVKRKVIDGHACSISPPYCRGDFELLETD
jgi:hypothetical protein